MPENHGFLYELMAVETTHAFETKDGHRYAYNPDDEQLFICLEDGTFQELILETSRNKIGVGGSIWRRSETANAHFKLTDSEPPRFFGEYSGYETVNVVEARTRIIAACLVPLLKADRPISTRFGDVIILAMPDPTPSPHHGRIYHGKVEAFGASFDSKSRLDVILKEDFVLKKCTIKQSYCTRELIRYETDMGIYIMNYHGPWKHTPLWSGEPTAPINFLNAPAEFAADQIIFRFGKTDSI